MCGLIAAFPGSTALEPRIRQVMQRMHRRGPDGEGFWQEDGACLGHRRLAILDIDQRGTLSRSKSAQRLLWPVQRQVLVQPKTGFDIAGNRGFKHGRGDESNARVCSNPRITLCEGTFV